MRPQAKKMLMFAPLAIAGIALLTFIGGEIVRRLWNWLMPAIFGWNEVTFWQALGLLVLCRILFGGFGGGGSKHSHRMTPEQRERFRQRMRDRFGSQSAPEQSGGS
jgi:hypothetical protein